MARKYAFHGGRLFISIDEVASILRELASEASHLDAAVAIAEIAVLFEKIETETLGEIANLETKA
jgi:hypothetical protein